MGEVKQPAHRSDEIQEIGYGVWVRNGQGRQALDTLVKNCPTEWATVTTETFDSRKHNFDCFTRFSLFGE